jgi:chromosome partitioning protein
MIIIAVYNIKGGVGKTAAAVNMSYLAARDGMRTLLCDLDPQGSATFYFRIKPKVKKGFKALLKGGERLDAGIKASDYPNLELLPADFSYRNLDLVLGQLKRSKKRLRQSLESLAGTYELIFLDCPPNITLVSENIFFAADYLLVPVIPTTLSYRTFDKLNAFLAKREFPADRILAFFSMVEYRKRMHQDLLQTMPPRFPYFLRNHIPFSSLIEKMGIYREPVPARYPQSTAGKSYALVWKEIRKKIAKQKR